MSIKEYPPQHNENASSPHIPVLLDAALAQLQPKKGETYLDLTAGYGGHASKVLEVTENYEGSVLVDRDENAIKHLQKLSDKGATLMHTDFATAAKELASEGKTFDMIMVDLGVSSPQLDLSERGFSFTHDGPLDMRMDQRQSLSAYTLVNKASVQELTGIIHKYGEEPRNNAQRIAMSIASHRPIENTKQLAEIILGLHRGKWQKVHPATRTFQALRIAVNDELGQVESMLKLIPSLLNKGGRVAVISFHSLEDRLVKHSFKEQFDAGLEAELDPLTKKPISGATDDVHNPRARSAKLRAAVKK